MSENRDMKAYVAVFVSIFIAELGDKTQLATLLFASDPAVSRVGVFLAAAAALVASSLLAVLAGAALGHAVAPGVLKTVAGIAFIAIGAWMLVAR
jgi:putative Ca2+/H+ antiporter (TMEM165/GDT1 family)